MPSATILEEYDLEYGTDAIEMHADSIDMGDRILIIDDLLATGGTAKATGKIVKKLKGEIVSYGFLIVLNELNGTYALKPGHVFTILEY